MLLEERMYSLHLPTQHSALLGRTAVFGALGREPVFGLEERVFHVVKRQSGGGQLGTVLLSADLVALVSNDGATS